jgi:FG-GAP-like repeat
MALGAAQVFASQALPSQFSSQTSKQKAAVQARLGDRGQNPTAAPAFASVAKLNGASKSSSSRPHRNVAYPQASQIGFVTATDIPSGGGAYFPAVAADFNGDGTQDVASIIAVGYNNQTSSWTFGISVVLSNGNGTFQPAVLTPNPNGNWGDQILVGDVNGDGKPDLVVVHTGSSGPSTCDVFLGNGNGSFTLANATPYPTSSYGLIGGALSDINGDGNLDVIVVDNQSPANFSVMLGNGNGSFQVPTSTALTGGYLSNIVFADFNGDGLLDFAASDVNSNNQTVVYLAQANGTYVAGLPLVTPEHIYGTCSTTAGDLNGDGKPEIVTVNCNPNTDDLTIYINNGDGTFQSGTYYAPAMDPASGTPADLTPVAVTIADVNGDGKPDLISVNNASSDITVLLGNGDGTVQVPSVGFATGGAPEFAAVVADFNGDGLADVIVPDYSFSFAYLQGYGNGTFRAAADYYAPIPDDYGAGSTTIASGDFNGDGFPDFVVGNIGYTPPSSGQSATGITVFLSNPDGSLQPGVNYASGGTLTGVAVADFNGDKILDIAAVDYSNNIVDIFQGNGNGTFTQTASYATGGSASNTSPAIILTGDFNNDGYPDLAIANYNSQNITVLLNNGAGAFLPPVAYGTGGYPYDMVAVDVNGDGVLDLVATDTNPGSIAVLLGNPDGTFQPASVSATAYNYLGNLAVGDLNGDGIPDLAFAIDDIVTGTYEIAVAQGVGNGTFQSPVLFSTTMQNINLGGAYGPYPGDIKMFDFNGDGKTDLLYTNEEYGTVGVLLNTGTNPFAPGMFYDPIEYPGGNHAAYMALADVNQDGAMDVVVAGDEFAGAAVLLNSSGSGVQPNFALVSTPTSVTVTSGNPASYNLTVTGSYGYTGTVSFTCSGLPTGSTCTFSPASVTANNSVPIPSTLSISTVGATAHSAKPTRPNSTPAAPILLASLGGLGLFGLVIGGSGKQRNRRIKMAILFGMMLLMISFSLVGCGNGNNNSMPTGTGTPMPGTASGTYTVTVTATGTGSIAHSVNLTLVVQ